MYVCFSASVGQSTNPVSEKRPNRELIYVRRAHLMQEMEERCHGEVDSLSEQLQVCESVLGEEKRLHSATQQEVSRLNQELELCRDDSRQEKAAMMEQIKVSPLTHSLATCKWSERRLLDRWLCLSRDRDVFV